MLEELDIVELQDESTVYRYDDEDRFYRDVKRQIKEGKDKIYIYNKTILDKILEDYPYLKWRRKDFYWEVINGETR